ncbi:MAG: hypothetical protein IKZ03_06565 [Clostridia bacterium]|nr:hypothetical protein [Clostridia bacterium]
MNITNGKKKLQSAWNSFLHSDPVVLRKTFSMKDVVYRKDSPECEIWRSEVHFDRDIYMIFLVLAFSGTVTYVAARRLWKKCKKCCSDHEACK